MGRALLIWCLVSADLRHRRTQSLLLIVMFVTTTTTLTLGLALGHTSQRPFARTRAQTKGPDLVAANGPGPGSPRPSLAQFTPLLHSRAVAATAGPFPVAFTRLTVGRRTVPADVEGRDRAHAPVDQPFLTSGQWVGRDGTVLEQGFARALGLHVGDTIGLGGRRLRVMGIAVATAQPFYPASAPGQVWAPRAVVRTLATPEEPLGYLLSVRLTRMASPDALETAVNAFVMAAPRVPSAVDTWQDIRRHDYRLIALDQKILLVGSWLLAGLALASIAVVVGGRMAQQTRRVGLLKAVGSTPRLVAAVLMTENLLLALAGAVIGVLLGGLLAPTVGSPGDGLLGPAPAPSVTLGSAAIVIAVAAGLAVIATLPPAFRAARTKTIRALADPAHSPRRRALVVLISAALPVPLLLGLRLVARRSRRAALTTLSLMIAVAMVVTALTVQHDVKVTGQGRVSVGFFSTSGVVHSANDVLLILSVILVILAGVSATFTAWATVVDAQTATALARALGATPRQITVGLATAQLLPGLLAACAGIPVGLLLYEAAGGHLREAQPPLSWLLAVIPGTLIVVAAVTAIPARLGARQPVAEVLRTA